MRLLISGSLRNKNTIGAFITAHLPDTVQYEVLTFPDAYALYLKTFFWRVINRIFPVLLVRKMDRMFVMQAEQYKPDVILVFKGMEISSWSLTRLKKKNILLVNYNFDHPYLFFSRGTGNRFVKQAIPFYDLHISYSSFIAADLSRKYSVRTATLPFGFHLSQAQYELVIADHLPEINRICFVGNPDEERVMCIGALLEAGLPVDVYGFGWEQQLTRHPQLSIHLPLQPLTYWRDELEFWKVLRQYRVQLNFFRPHNERSHNLRTFEVPAAGGILLTPQSEEQAIFFEPDKEVFFYTGTEELIAQCKRLLNEAPERIQSVRENARHRSVSGDYSYARRTLDLLHLLIDLNTIRTTQR